MTDKKDGGPASSATCTRNQCGKAAVRKQGNQWLCAKHYRFGQMRCTARRFGKAVPSHDELERMAAHGLACLDCGVDMNWLAVENQTRVASLQHYRDGTLGLVCRSCNTRHAFAPGDSYREQDKDSKFCPGCKTVKPLAEYLLDRGRGFMGNKSFCKVCSKAGVYSWRKLNPEKARTYQRNWRAKKADAMLAIRVAP